MKVRLLHPDRDAELDTGLSQDAADLVTDLDLQPVLDAMRPEPRLDKICPSTLLRPLTDPEPIRWRQAVLADAINHPILLRELFSLATQAQADLRGVWMWSGRNADSLLSKALNGLHALLPSLQRLGRIAANRSPIAGSAGLRQLYERAASELDAGYLDQVRTMLRQLGFPEGVTSLARVTDQGLVGGLLLLAPRTGRRSWREALGLGAPGSYRFTLADRDEAGARALSELRDDALYQVAKMLAEATEHMIGFFRQLQWEAGFYVGCLQLYEQLQACGVQVCWPEPLGPGSPPRLEASGLTSLSLALRTASAPVPNDVTLPPPGLAVLTGANQGGKTTFLRSVGCAQLLLQAGMFVPADGYRSSVANAVHSHFRQAEDDSLRSGKLDEELGRMSRIVDNCRPGDLVLMNESFASTDEIEGSLIAQEIIDAMLRHGVRVVLVTHFHALASHYLGRDDAVFLRPERLPNGERSYRILPARPEPTSHGLDVYRKVFGSASEPLRSASQPSYASTSRNKEESDRP